MMQAEISPYDGFQIWILFVRKEKLYSLKCIKIFKKLMGGCSKVISTAVDPILNNDETEYRKEIESSVTRYQANNVSLNVSKIKELVIAFRKWGDVHASVSINIAEGEIIMSFKFWGVNITSHINAMAKNASSS